MSHTDADKLNFPKKVGYTNSENKISASPNCNFELSSQNSTYKSLYQNKKSTCQSNRNKFVKEESSLSPISQSQSMIKQFAKPPKLTVKNVDKTSSGSSSINF